MSVLLWVLIHHVHLVSVLLWFVGIHCSSCVSASLPICHQLILIMIISVLMIRIPSGLSLLLLLRNDLKENMIPHHSKLRELIIDAWREYFQALKKDLVVSTNTLILTYY